MPLNLPVYNGSMRALVRFLLRHEYLIWILSGSILLRLPSLLEPYWYGDEGIYLTLGHALRSGLQLYRDIHDNKPPLLYLFAAVSGSVFWFRMLLIIVSSIGIVFFERLARLVLKEENPDGSVRIAGIVFPRPRWSTLATALFAVLPFFAEGAIANGEVFMIVPSIVAFWLLARTRRADDMSGKMIVAAGIFFSLAFLFKVPALFDTVAAGLFFFLLLPEKSFSTRFRQITLFVIAWSLPVLISVIYYVSLGVGTQYISAAFLQNVGYLSSWSSGTHQSSPLQSSGLLARGGILLGCIVVLLLLRRFVAKETTLLLLLWLSCAVFGALLSERPYPHYLIQVLPPLALLIPHAIRLAFEALRHKGRGILDLLVITGVVLIAMLGVSRVHFWYYPVLPYYKNYVDFVLGKQSRDDYFAYFDRSLPDLYGVAEHVARETKKTDRIFVWGDHPMLYALSRRLPPGKYTSAYHVLDFRGEAETIAAIESMKPLLIILDREERRVLPGLETILQEEYALVENQSARFSLYRRINRRLDP